MNARIPGPGRHGLSHGGTPRPRRPRVTVYNRSAAKAAQWVAAHGGRSAERRPRRQAAREIVMMCVGNDDDVRAVASGSDGALAGMAPGAILVDHTTASAEVAREVHAAARSSGVGFLDAPVSGGQAGAENGKLTIMVGGDAAAFARAKACSRTYARAVTLHGRTRRGQLTKMVNQICIAGLVRGAVGRHRISRCARDSMPQRVLDVISKGAAQSWQMENRGKTMVADKFDFGFAVDWMRKDLAICLDEARRNGAVLPVTAIVDQLYAQVQARGGGRWDTSSLIRLARPPDAK